MTVDEETLIQSMMERAPFEGAAEARSALQAVLAALRSGLADDDAAALAEDLGGPWAEPLRRGGYQGRLVLEEFYRLVAWHEERRPSVAAEHAQITCAALASLLADSTLERLSRQLPELAALFVQPVTPEAPLGPHYIRFTPAREHSLAAGRPGSARPLSEASPASSRPLSGARPELAHAHSVARSDDPHADTRLSSSTGLTQEREHESLARARKNAP